jgi:glucose-1-phosphate thymidylyltransferase
VPVKVVGVLPAAGRAARLQPLPGSKEMLEVGGRPVLDYAVERMRVAGAGEIRLVTRPDKADVRDHAEELGLVVIEAEPATVGESILAAVEALLPDDVVLLGLPDTVWEPADGFVHVLRALSPDADAVLGVFRSAEPERGDVVTLAAGGAVRGVAVKPAQPTANVVWGFAVARVSALMGLSRHSEPGTLFDELAGRNRVRAVRFEGEFIDIGTKDALGRARELLG